MVNHVIVGSRDSRLALWQTNWVIERLREAYPEVSFEIRRIKTHGDRVADVPLPAIGDKGLFVKEIESALQAGEIDMAVHSMKDVPTQVTPGLVIAAMTRRADPRDAFVSMRFKSLSELSPGSRIGTGSLRRVAQLRHFRPDVVFEPIRGNLDTRLRKLATLGLDGVIIAAAGLDRMGWGNKEGTWVERLSLDICLPAVGQGALGVQIRTGDEFMFDLVSGARDVRDVTTEQAVGAERAFLDALGGGCHVPIGALSEICEGELRLRGVVADLDGHRLVRGEITGPAVDGYELGKRLAADLRGNGADDILTILTMPRINPQQVPFDSRTGSRGKVYLVGAGPGDPGLLTLRGKECIEKAGVIVYDRLASDQVLSYARPGTELIYAGKQSSNHPMPQGEINRLLVEKAQDGHTVTRLKGGDPFIFGRGGEEAEFIRQHGIDFEIVPGVTSAIAGPAYAGIPLTHRGLASSVAIVTGHEDPVKEASSINWERLATATDTIVFLMGMENLPKIVDKLLAFGRRPETPVALVKWGTTVEQETLTGSLGSIAELAQTAGFGSPSVIVVGDVVRLRPILKWFEQKPLFGKRVVVTRSRAQAGSLSKLLREYGAEALEFPSIATMPPEDFEPLDVAILGVEEYDWVIFTSVNGVEAFFDRLRMQGKDVRALGRARVAAIGEETAKALNACGIRADYVPAEYRAEAILDGFPDREVVGKRFLLPRAAEAREVLPEGLTARGARVDEVVAYRTVMGDSKVRELKSLLEEGRVHVVTFTSSSTVRNFFRMLAGDRAQEGATQESVTRLLSGVTIACIGPVTAQTVREAAGLPVHAVARKYTIEGLVEALVDHFCGQGGNVT